MAIKNTNEWQNDLDQALYSGKVPKVSADELNTLLSDLNESVPKSKENVLRFGDDQNTDKTIEAGTTSVVGNRPKIRFNTTASQWEFSNDGSTWNAFGESLQINEGMIGTLELADDAISTVKILDNNVTNPKLAQMANNTIKGNLSGATADPRDEPTIDAEDQSRGVPTMTINGTRLLMVGRLYNADVAIPQIPASSTDVSMFNATSGEYSSGAASYPHDATASLEFFKAGDLKTGTKIEVGLKGLAEHNGASGVVFKVDVLGATRHTHTCGVIPAGSKAYKLTVEMDIEKQDATTGIIEIQTRYEYDGGIEVQRTRVTALDTTLASTFNVKATTDAGESIDVSKSEVLKYG